VSVRSSTPASRSATANGVTGSVVQASRAAPTAGRALRVLELVASDPARPWKLAEVQRQLGYSHGNLHAIAATLVAMGYLRRDDHSRGYRLGPALLGLGRAARELYSAVDCAEPELRRLARDLGTETHAATRTGAEILVVARYGPPLPEGDGVRVGLRIPLTPPMGSTLMAWAPPDEVDRYLASATPDVPVARLERIRGALQQVRRRGYSVHVFTGPRQALDEAASRAVEEGMEEAGGQLATLAHQLADYDYLPPDPSRSHIHEGVQLSAPVFGPTGEVELSVGVVFAGSDLDPAVVVRAPEALLEAAAAATRALGGRPPGD
jgi:DNA-binding IclR family transcriptional regulator